MTTPHTPLAAEVDDATPVDAVKWSFVRRRAIGELLAHGYHEVAPPPRVVALDDLSTELRRILK